MIQKVNISRILSERRAPHSFHTFSEENVRIEFRNLRPEDKVGPFEYEGDVILTCYGGLFELEIGDDVGVLEDHDQALITRGHWARISCLEVGSLQFIWSPGHAPTRQ